MVLFDLVDQEREIGTLYRSVEFKIWLLFECVPNMMQKSYLKSICHGDWYT